VLFNGKLAISRKWWEIWSRLLLITNMKWHTPSQIRRKSLTLDDLELEGQWQPVRSAILATAGFLVFYSGQVKHHWCLHGCSHSEASRDRLWALGPYQIVPSPHAQPGPEQRPCGLTTARLAVSKLRLTINDTRNEHITLRRRMSGSICISICDDRLGLNLHTRRFASDHGIAEGEESPESDPLLGLLTTDWRQINTK